MRKGTIIAMFGAILEAYDFLIYSFFASFLAKIFFDHSNDLVIYIETFIIFSVGYISRPLGGIVIGGIGDRIGRKNALIFVMQLMSISTFLIACLPSYQTLGILSPILLMILRILQGIAHGAEIPGALIYAIESCETEGKKEFSSSLIFFGVGLGGILSSIISLVISKIYTDKEIIEYAWRIPFIIGGFLSFLAFYFRAKAMETIEFEKEKDKTKTPVKHLTRFHKREVILATSMSILPAIMIITGHYMPAYLKEFTNHTSEEVYFAILCASITFAIMVLVAGYILTFVAAKYFLLFVSIIICLGASIMLWNFNIESPIIFVVLFKILSSSVIASYPCLVTKLFPTKIRYTGVAASYNISFVFGSLLLFYTTSLARKYSMIEFVPMLILAAAIFNIIVLIISSRITK